MRKQFLGCLIALMAFARLVSGQTVDIEPASKFTFPSVSADPTILPNKTDTTQGPTPKTVQPPPALDHEPGPDGLFGEGSRSDCAWISAEYLLWWFKRQQTPALVTTGNPVFQGILGQPSTVILFGAGAGQDEEPRSGVRVNAGIWLDCEKCWNLEFSGLYFPQRTDRHVIGDNLSVFLARPFFDLNAMRESSQIDSQMGLAKGSKTVATPTRLWGGEFDVSRKICCGCCYQVDLIFGPRFLELDDTVQVDEFLKVATDLSMFPEFARFAGDVIQVQDRFSTRNQFYGGQVGIDAAGSCGPWQLEVRAKLAMGNTHEIIDISGMQTITTPTGAVSHFVGGLLALPTNIGHFNRDEFSVMPEVTINAGYRYTNWLCGYIGYNFLYWSRVARAGDQIDRVIDAALIPNFGTGLTPTGINRPTVPFRQSDFWAHGFDFGFEVTW
jgi:hypothetical protein